ncbi:hypothetical protein D3C84_471590 [compost metagenome]
MSTAVGTAVAATDTLLVGIGKLQAQVSATIANLADYVRGTVLTGLSTASSAVITASDTVLSALGKLQAQISAFGTAALANLTTSPTDTTSGRAWRTNDLVKTTSTYDTNTGSITRVGDGGLLGDGVLADPDTTNLASGFYANGTTSSAPTCRQRRTTLSAPR